MDYEKESTKKLRYGFKKDYNNTGFHGTRLGTFELNHI